MYTDIISLNAIHRYKQYSKIIIRLQAFLLQFPNTIFLKF